MKPKAAILKLINKSRESFRRVDSEINELRKCSMKLHQLERLAIQGDWVEWEKHFLTHGESSTAHTFSHGDNLLHMVCRFHPPVSVVRMVLRQREPLLAVQEVNSQGQIPLHVAAASGASYKVVHLLLEQSMCTVMAQDSAGNTPLHLHFLHCCGQKVCDPGFSVPNITSSGRFIPTNSIRSTASTVATSQRSSFGSLMQTLTHRSNSLSVSCHSEDEHSARFMRPNLSQTQPSKHEVEQVTMLVQGPTHEIVFELAAASPRCLLLENDDSLSVIELAIMFEADLKTVTKLQEISRRYMKSITERRPLTMSDENYIFDSRHNIYRNAAA